MSDIVLAVITTVVGLVGGGVITVYLTKKKTPSWACKLNVLFNNGVSQIDGLKIKYKEFDVDNLSSAYLVFWNNGKETIKNDEIVEKIIISVKEPYNIYLAEVVQKSRDSNQFEVVSVDENKSVQISFRYLDNNQGAVIHIFTNCLSPEDIELSGAIMGCKQIKKCVNRKTGTLFEIFPSIITIAFSLASMQFIETFNIDKIISTIVFLFTILVICIVSFLISYYSRLKNQIPKEFKKYF